MLHFLYNNINNIIIPTIIYIYIKSFILFNDLINHLLNIT